MLSQPRNIRRTGSWAYEPCPDAAAWGQVPKMSLSAAPRFE